MPLHIFEGISVNAGEMRRTVDHIHRHISFRQRSLSIICEGFFPLQQATIFGPATMAPLSCGTTISTEHVPINNSTIASNAFIPLLIKRLTSPKSIKRDPTKVGNGLLNEVLFTGVSFALYGPGNPSKSAKHTPPDYEAVYDLFTETPCKGDNDPKEVEINMIGSRGPRIQRVSNLEDWNQVVLEAQRRLFFLTTSPRNQRQLVQEGQVICTLYHVLPGPVLSRVVIILRRPSDTLLVPMLMNPPHWLHPILETCELILLTAQKMADPHVVYALSKWKGDGIDGGIRITQDVVQYLMHGSSRTHETANDAINDFSGIEENVTNEDSDTKSWWSSQSTNTTTSIEVLPYRDAHDQSAPTEYAGHSHKYPMKDLQRTGRISTEERVGRLVHEIKEFGKQRSSKNTNGLLQTSQSRNAESGRRGSALKNNHSLIETVACDSMTNNAPSGVALQRPVRKKEISFPSDTLHVYGRDSPVNPPLLTPHTRALRRSMNEFRTEVMNYFDDELSQDNTLTYKAPKIILEQEQEFRTKWNELESIMRRL